MSKWGSDYAAYAAEQSGSAKRKRGRAYTEAVMERAQLRAKEMQYSIDESKTPTKKQLQRFKTLNTELRRSVVRHQQALSQLESLTAAASASGISPLQAAKDVAQVVGTFKNRDPNTIAAADPLTKYYFETDEKRTMAILLDDFYLDSGRTMEELIQPWETEDAKYIADFIAAVLKHNPH